MAAVATPSQPRNIPGHGLSLNLPLNSPTSQPSRSGYSGLEPPFSPVAQNGSFEFDRIIKEGEVLKRTRKTKSWKPIYIVLRPNLLSIYRDKNESKLRHQINLSDLTAVARQKDPKRTDKARFALFSPSRNYHLEALSEQDAQAWVDIIRQEARIDAEEEEMYLASPGGTSASPYQSFGRFFAAQKSAGADDGLAGYTSSSDVEGLNPGHSLPKARSIAGNAQNTMRKPSFASYSGADHGSVSDFSDAPGAAARLSALSLANTDPRPSTSSARPHAMSLNAVTTPNRPLAGLRSASQTSGLRLSAEDLHRAQNPYEEERVVHQAWVFLLKSKSGVRQWKKVWLVVRPKSMALYKNEEEYTALLVLPLTAIVDAVEIDPISKSKTHCMQIISEERNYRLGAMDEESLSRCLGALKSLIVKRKAKAKEKEAANVPPVAVAAPS